MFFHPQPYETKVNKFSCSTLLGHVFRRKWTNEMAAENRGATEIDVSNMRTKSNIHEAIHKSQRQSIQLTCIRESLSRVPGMPRQLPQSQNCGLIHHQNRSSSQEGPQATKDHAESHTISRLTTMSGSAMMLQEEKQKSWYTLVVSLFKTMETHLCSEFTTQKHRKPIESSTHPTHPTRPLQ